MKFIDKLPVVEKCFFCVKLKLGCILIAIFGIIHGCVDASLFILPQMCKNSEGLYTMLLKIATYLCSVSTVLFLLACVILLIGIFINRKITAMVFIYCDLFSLLTYVFFYITCILVTLLESDCEVRLYLISVLIDLIIWTHFLLVVRSYKDDMD